MSILQFIIIIAAYLASMFVFYFIANIICTLADWDTDYLVILSFVWPASLAGVFMLLIFSGINLASDKICDKIEDLLCAYKRKKSGKNSE